MVTRLAPVCALFAILGGLVLLSVMAVTFANAAAFTADRLARLAGGSVTALPGYEDFVRLAVSSGALMMFPYCQLHRGHIAVDLFTRAAPPLVRGALDRTWCAATALLVGFLAVFMARGMAETRADNVVSPILGWPEWPFYLPGIAALGLWAMVAAAEALDRTDEPAA